MINRLKNIVILICMTLGFTSCYVYENTSSRIASTYTPLQYEFDIDSAYLEKYGMKAAKTCIDIGTADEWIVDSITYCTFYLRQEQIKIPIVPFIFALRFDKRNTSYNIDIKIHDTKNQYETLDSIAYRLYDETQNRLTEGVFCYKGKNGLNSDSLLKYPGYIIYMPKIIDMNSKLEAKDSVVYGDIELYFTDINGQFSRWSDPKVRFKYSRLRRLTADMNW